MSQKQEVILRFNTVSFEYGPMKPILDEVNFSMRKGSKVVLMGQNGAGKSTIFQLITGHLQPEDGLISIKKGASIAIAQQVIPRDSLKLTIKEYFEQLFSNKVYDIDPRIDNILKVVNLDVPTDRPVGQLSGGQQAKILLASALIQEPDILLLDEPTNNLDPEALQHLTQFLIDYKGTCLVISHDADFLNAFTEGVFYLDIFKQKIEQYRGNYNDVVKEIIIRIEKEQRMNARFQKEIQERKDKANYFAQKGGKMRNVAKKMRDRVEELEESMAEVRQEDRTIRSFAIPTSGEVSTGLIVTINSVSVIEKEKLVEKKTEIALHGGERLLLYGPNGIGKTTFLERIVRGEAPGVVVEEGVTLGYYRQDFSTLNPEQSVFEALQDAAHNITIEEMRSLAAGFLFTSDMMRLKIKELSEGQKGLLSFALLTLRKPDFLILDEPTNHINFRHLPVIAKALDRYQGAMILVSHLPEFVSAITITERIDLSDLKKK